MNSEPLLHRLLQAAQADTPSEGVPYAFEKRVMARLRTRPSPDIWAFWGTLLWRALGPCCVIMIAIGATAMAADRASEDLRDPLQTVLLADLDSRPDSP